MALLTISFVATTFTDSHPVMTADGPKRAGALVDGDDVLVSHASAHGPVTDFGAILVGSETDFG